MAALAESDWPNVAYLSVLLLVVAGSYFASSSNRFRDIRALFVWTGIAAALVLVYSFRAEGQMLWQRLAGSLVPGYAIEREGEIAFMRSNTGMFDIRGAINGARVDFTFDTGASAVTLTAEDAKRAGYDLPESAFTARVATANGEARAAVITLDLVEIGPINERNVEAMVAKSGALDGNLLGHSFLDRLTSYQVEGDTLTFRYR